MANQIVDSSIPNTVNFTVARRYLTEREIERLMDTARKVSRHGHRDATMILVVIAMGCEQAKSAASNGIRSSSTTAACTSKEIWIIHEQKREARRDPEDLPLAYLLPTIFIAVFFSSTLAVASSFVSGLAAAHLIYPPQVSIWIEDPTLPS